MLRRRSSCMQSSVKDSYLPTCPCSSAACTASCWLEEPAQPRGVSAEQQALGETIQNEESLEVPLQLGCLHRQLLVGGVWAAQAKAPQSDIMPSTSVISVMYICSFVACTAGC